MKNRTRSVVIVAVLAAVMLGSCAGVNMPTIGDAAAALAYSSVDIATRTSMVIGLPIEELSVRGPATGIYIYGSHGGAVWFDFQATESPYTGTADFDEYAFEAPDGTIYTLDGTMNLVVTDGGDDTWTASFDGTITLTKDADPAGEPRTFTVDLDYGIAFDLGDTGLTITITASGTVNSSTIDEVFEYTLIGLD